jgi:hypothetical protein
MVVGLTGLARSAAADPIPTLPIVLQVAGHGNVPLHIVALAKAEVTRIYRDAGVNVVWIDAASSGGRSHPLQSSGTSDPGFALVVLPREMSDQLPVAATALGVAIGTSEHRGRTAYVFYSRVEHIAQTHLNVSRDAARKDLYSVVVLAHAMAHEIGHLLLPYGHSATGLMRADWNATDLNLALDGRLNFTSEQAELIRGQLLARIADTQATRMAWRCALLNSGPEYVRATVSGDWAIRRARSWDSKMEIPESRQLAVSEAHRSTTVDNHTPA